jgi:hypothetical protein
VNRKGERILSKQYDFTDLVLLIGNNPLPNYVVAKFFHLTNKNLQRIWLIHSEENKFSRGTGRYADNIENVLRNEFKNPNIQYLKEPLPDVSQASEIVSEVKKLFSNREAQIKSLHLNYTGGTKAMSVHVYQALNIMFKEKFSASYLDARDYHIKLDENPDLVTGDLRNLIQIENSDLFKLHSYSKNDVKQKKTYLDFIKDKSKSDAILQCLAELANKSKVLDLKNWFNKAEQKGLFKEGKKDSNRIDEALGGYNLFQNPELFAYLSAFPDNDRFADMEGNWIYNNYDSKVNSKTLKEFNKGGWLESYVVWV